MQGKTKLVLVLIMGILLIFKSSFANAEVPSLRDKLKPLVRQGCVLVADEQKVLFRYPEGLQSFIDPRFFGQTRYGIDGLQCFGQGVSFSNGILSIR